MNLSDKNNLPKRIAQVIDKSIVVFCSAIAGGSILIMTTLITVDVLGRYLFQKPTMVAVEISGYLLVGLVYLGLVYTGHVDRHIKIEIFTDRLKPHLRKKLNDIVGVFTILFSSWLAWFTLGPVKMDFELGSTSLTGTAIPMWMPGALIPLGFALLAMKLFAQLIINLESESKDIFPHE